MRVVGRPTDVRLFRLQYSRVKAQIDRLTLFNGQGMGRSFCDSYRKGLVIVINERLNSMRAEVRASATSTALVKLDERESQAMQTLKSLHSNLHVSRPPKVRAYKDGFQAGLRDGHKIGLGEELTAPIRGLPCSDTAD